MKIAIAVLAAGLIVSCLTGPVRAQATDEKSACAPANGLHFVCGVVNPEDIVQVPGTRFLITSGFQAGAGPKIVDTEAKTFQLLYTGAPSQMRPDTKTYPGCTAAPDPKTIFAHGIYLRPAKTGGHYVFYVITHGKAEAVQVFDIDATGEAPRAAWSGCILMPEGYHTNSLAAYSDGTVITTVSYKPGKPREASIRGEPTGDVLEWKPGTTSVNALPGTELAGNNGIEISHDESEFYVVAFGTGTVFVFSRTDTSKPLRQVMAPGFLPDNLRWSGDRLIAAGAVYDEPACGGTRVDALSAPPGAPRCYRGYTIAELNPLTMTWKVLAYAEPRQGLGSVATGMILGDTLWIAAAHAPGLGYRTLPGRSPAQ